MRRGFWCLALCWACGSSSEATDAGGDTGLDSGVEFDASGSDSGADALDSGSNTDSDVREPDVGPERCEEAASRVTTCGLCGERSERCVDGAWTPASECLGQGVCEPASVETDENDRCLRRQRLCNVSCEWSEWTILREEGECARGAVERAFDECDYPSDFAERTCSDACEWEAFGVCTDACVRDLDREGTDAQVCVPGDQVRLQVAPGEPFFTARVSTFSIDRYAATRAAYRACVNAGACPAEGAAMPDINHDVCALLGLCDERIDTASATVTATGADAYCAWRGGRVPTYAELVLAGRGASPSECRFPWCRWEGGRPVGDRYSCDGVPSDDDTGCARPTKDTPVDGSPATASVFGVEGLAGTWVGQTWARDGFVSSAGFRSAYETDDPIPSGECRTLVEASFADPMQDLSSRFSSCFGSAEVRCAWEE